MRGIPPPWIDNIIKMDLVRITTAPVPALEHRHPDLDLAEAILRRDRKATAEWVDRFSGPVYNYVRSRLTRRTEEVDDVVQDVFIAAWQCLSGYRGSSPLGAWLMGIARHKVEDHYRRRLPEWQSWDEAGTPDPPDDSSPPVDELLDEQRRTGRARGVLAQLPEHYATVLLWRYWERRPAREIAAGMGRTEKSVERLLARARENFKRRWLENA